MTAPEIGVLALQGGVAEHLRMLETIGARGRTVRTAAALDGLDGIVLPGGESSTMDRLLRRFGMFAPLQEAVASGLPTLATCAGLILLAREVLDPAPGQRSLGVLDVSVRRNAFGRQIDSVTETVRSRLGDDRVAFIRAPRVEHLGPGVEVLARRDPAAVPNAVDQAVATDPSRTPDPGPVVAVETESILALGFHPELTGATAFHRELVRRAQARRAARPYARRK